MAQRGRGRAGKGLASKAQAEEAKPYHHGDLRRALLDAALGLLAEPGGAGLLTLREVARRAGVSHAAPYRHFDSKEALLAEVAEEGFRRMREEMVQRVAGLEAEPLRRHQQMGVGYVLFALRHPAHFRVMFGPELKFDQAGLQGAASAAFGELVGSVVHCQEAGVMRPGAPLELALASWSLVHGLAQLAVDGRLVPAGYGTYDTEQLAQRVLELLAQGMATPLKASR